MAETIKATNAKSAVPGQLVIALLTLIGLLISQPQTLAAGSETEAFKPYQPPSRFAPAAPALPPRTLQESRFAPNPGDDQSPAPQPGAEQNGQADQPFVVTPDGIPALNIIAPNERPPIPPPPATPEIAPNSTAVAPSPPQAWRVKAFQLFKLTKLDNNTQLAFTLDAGLADALTGLRQAAEEEGLTVQAQAYSSGHMLITFNDNGRLEKAIVAMRPRNSDQDATSSGADAGNPDMGAAIARGQSCNRTDVRVQCDSRNRTLTNLRLKEILNRLQAGLGDSKTRSETL